MPESEKTRIFICFFFFIEWLANSTVDDRKHWNKIFIRAFTINGCQSANGKKSSIYNEISNCTCKSFIYQIGCVSISM